MTTRDYLRVLTGLEMQLRRHASPWGFLDGDEQTQSLRQGWACIARHLKEEHPRAPTPIPFWERTTLMGLGRESSDRRSKGFRQEG